MPAPITITPTEIPDVLLITSKVFGDGRGFFIEAYAQQAWAEAKLPTTFAQDSMSRSAKGTLRGLHYQLNPHAQGKFVRAVHGALFDVAVDLRKGSPTYGRAATATLRDDDGAALWIPPGFAHGFLALEDDTVIYYKSTTPYAPQSERTIAYNDPKIAINWPTLPETLSPKDATAPTLTQAETNFAYSSASSASSAVIPETRNPRPETR